MASEKDLIEMLGAIIDEQKAEILEAFGRETVSDAELQQLRYEFRAWRRIRTRFENELAASRSKGSSSEQSTGRGGAG